VIHKCLLEEDRDWIVAAKPEKLDLGVAGDWVAEDWIVDKRWSVLVCWVEWFAPNWISMWKRWVEMREHQVFGERQGWLLSLR